MHPDIKRKWGHLRHIHKRGSEWHAECPECGSIGHDWSNPKDPPDRFHMHPPSPSGPAWGACRQCGFHEFADSGRKLLTLDELKKRTRLVESAREKEQKRHQSLLKQFRKERPWVTHHEQMSSRARSMWRKAGIPDGLQDRLSLGEVNEFTYFANDTPHITHALSIPYFEYGWLAVQEQFRLTNPVANAGKYRWLSGLGSRLYLADPDEKVEGEVILCEGAKKAIVTYLELVLRGDQRRFTIVATPSKTPSTLNVERLEKASVVYICLDPDAFEVSVGSETAIGRLVRMIGRERARVVSLPDKIDDLINLGATWEDLLPYLWSARKP